MQIDAAWVILIDLIEDVLDLVKVGLPWVGLLVGMDQLILLNHPITVLVQLLEQQVYSVSLLLAHFGKDEVALQNWNQIVLSLSKERCT